MCPAGPLRSTVVTRFVATMSPADFRRRRLPVTRALGSTHERRTTQVPDLTFGARCPQPPRKARRLNVPVATPPVTDRPYFGRKATSLFVTRPNRVQCLRPTPSASRASTSGSPRAAAWSPTCRTGNLHGQHLTVNESSQAWPDAPKTQRRKGVFLCAFASLRDHFWSPVSVPCK
jgi:hypothetical protein